MLSPRVSSYFTQLPIELLEEIVKYSFDSPQALANLSPVCKVVHNWITPILYESVYLSNANQIALFAATIEETPRLRPLVSRLCIFVAEYHVPLKSSKDPFVERENSGISCWSDVPLSEEGSPFPSDDDNEEDGAMEVEDLILEHEAVPEDSIGSPPGGFTAFKPRVHPTSPYEFVFTPAALNSIRPGLSSAARFFRSVIWDVSLVPAHSLVIVRHCVHLHTLIAVVDRNSSFMFGGIKDLTLHDAPSDLIDPPQLNRYVINPSEPQIHDYSALTHLTLLGLCYPLRHLPERAPNITHLCMRRDTCIITRDMLVNLQHLTHLWITPSREIPTSFWQDQLPLPEFLEHLHENCAALVRVRVDAGPDDNMANIDHGLFPFAHVHRYTHVDPSWYFNTIWERDPVILPENSDIAETLHIYTPPDVEMDSQSDSSSDIRLEKMHKKMVNVYTARLNEYWTQRRYGGGWDE